MQSAFKQKQPWSLWATRFCVAVLTFAIGIGAQWASTFIPPESTPQQPTHATYYASAEPGTLRARILEAKVNGDKVVELSVLGCGWDIGGLQKALSRDTVVLAELLGKKTYEDPYGLSTWYRFRIKETLVENAPPRFDYLFQNPPSDMLPIAEDEFLVHETNGRMEIDGITVIQHSNGPAYLEAQTYLLFLWINPSKRTAIRSSTDPLGVFLVEADGNLRSYIDRPYPLKTHLAKRFKNSVNNMRQALKK